MKHVNVTAIKNFSSHPIRSIKESVTHFFERHMEKTPSISTPFFTSTSYHAIFPRAVAAMIVLTTLMLFKPEKIEAKPGPFYRSFSLFSYWLLTPTDGMFGDKTNFWVKEAGLTYPIPYSLSFGPKDTVKTHGGEIAISSRGNVSVTPMILGGVTRAEGLPPAETNFEKAALTVNTTYGKHALALGVRGIWASSLEWSFNAGRRTITIPSENYFDVDLGAKYSYKQDRKDTTSFIRGVSGEFTRFNAHGTIRDPYYVFKGSVDFPGGWGIGSSYDTRAITPSFDVNKSFVWNRGQQMLFLGAGYEPGARSVAGYVGGMTGPVMAMVAYQTEGGDPSYHFLVDINPAGLYKAVFGSADGHK